MRSGTISAVEPARSQAYTSLVKYEDPPMSIDVWAQVTTERMANAPWLEPLLRWTGRTDTLPVPTVQSTLQAMDAAGVEVALLSAWYGPEGSLISNEEVAAQIAAAPGRFR